jgi:hypothetical protein
MSRAGQPDEAGGVGRPDDPARLGADELPGLADAAEEFAQLLRRPVAPVRLPAPDELEVRLVSEQALERLFDAESDASIHTNIALLLIGTLLGFFTNIATADEFEWSRAVTACVTLLGVTACVLGLLAVRSHRRVRHLRQQMVGGSLQDE